MADYRLVDVNQLESDLTELADSIRAKGKTTDPLLFPEGLKSAVESIPTPDVIESLIDESGVLDSTEGTATEKVEQVLDLAYTSSINKSLDFDGLGITGRFEFDCKNVMNLKCGFRRTKLSSIHLRNTQKVVDWTDAFYWCTAETIETLDFSGAQTTNNGTLNGGELKNLMLVPQTLSKSLSIGCPNLSAESIQSIINGLAYVETARTLTLHSSVTAKLTDEQYTAIFSKNWTIG